MIMKDAGQAAESESSEEIKHLKISKNGREAIAPLLTNYLEVQRMLANDNFEIRLNRSC